MLRNRFWEPATIQVNETDDNALQIEVDGASIGRGTYSLEVRGIVEDKKVKAWEPLMFDITSLNHDDIPSDTAAQVENFADASSCVLLLKYQFIGVNSVTQQDFEAIKEEIDLIKEECGACISTTWAELKAMRDNGELKAGQAYRITDYQCTTTQADTRSAGHQFDIVVMALSPSELSEQAMAALHEGDTYFANAKLEAWELKYCLDNDTDHFAWADTQNGKGVIYDMKDEWNNHLPYDFKNIMFKRCYCTPEELDETGCYLAIPYMSVGPDNNYLQGHNDDDYIYVYTFSCLATLDEVRDDHPAQADASMGLFQTENEISADYDDSPRPSNNVFEPYIVNQSIDDEPLRKVRALPNITFQQIFADEFSYRCHNNHISGSCHDWSCRSKHFYNNDFAEAEVAYCYFSGEVYYNTFSGNVNNNTFSGDVYGNTFSGWLENNTFSGYVRYNTFSGDVYGNTFSGWLENNTFSGNVNNNTFSGDVYGNTFSGDVYGNTFSGDVYGNTFSGDVYGNTFSGNVYCCQFKGYTQWVDFVYTGKMQHVTVGGHIEGTVHGHKRATVAGDAKYEQVVTADRNGNVVVTAPYV